MGQVNAHIWITWVSVSNEKKLDNPVNTLKLATMDSEHLSTSNCHSSELSSVACFRDISKGIITDNYVFKNEKYER